MIKPNDVRFQQSERPPAMEAHFAQCEEDFDAAIRHAESTGTWPAVVRNSRDAMPVAVIDAVAAKYEAEGWIVQHEGVGRDVRATIMMPKGHPDRT
jgi:hypothetical protein